MAASIMSLFGPSAQELMQQKQAQSLQMAQALASNPRAARDMLEYQAGEALATGALKLFGYQDPALKRASALESTMLELQQELGPEGFQNPEILFPTFAKKLNDKGFAKEAAMVMMEGQRVIQDYRVGNAKIMTEQAQLAKAARPELTGVSKLLAEKRAAQEVGDAEAVAVLDQAIAKETSVKDSIKRSDFGQVLLDAGYAEGSPEYVNEMRKFAQNKLEGTAKGSGNVFIGQDVMNQDGNPVGQYDDKGNFTSKAGRVIPKETMATFGEAQETSTKLLSMFDNITQQDIDKGFGTVDTTQNQLLAAGANPEIVAAQYKINQVGVRDVLNNLKDLKGASSDREMARMASTFPGFMAKPEVMKQWLARAKATTLDFLNRQKNSYGFDAPPVDLQAVATDPLFASLSEQERATMIERLARWDSNFKALDEKDQIRALASLTGAKAVIGGEDSAPVTRKTLNGKTYEFDGKGWKVAK